VVFANYDSFTTFPHGAWTAPMIDLVKEIAASDLARELCPRTSHFALCLHPEVPKLSTPIVAFALLPNGEYECTYFRCVGERLRTVICSQADAVATVLRFAREMMANWNEDSRQPPAADPT